MKKFNFKDNRDKLFDKFGKPIVTGLFEELYDARTGGKFVMFKLSDWKQTYLDCRDPTDYKPALALIGDWPHWNNMLRNPKFRAEVEKWRAELDVLLESEGIEHLRTQGANGNVAAAKFLAKKEYKDTRAGRPNKKVPQDMQDHIENENDVAISEDMKRLGLKVVVGG